MLIFYNNPDYLTNIMGLANILDKSYPTVRKAISDLVSTGVLTKLVIGNSHVIKINEYSPYTKALFNFFNTVQSEKESEND